MFYAKIAHKTFILKFKAYFLQFGTVYISARYIHAMKSAAATISAKSNIPLRCPLVKLKKSSIEIQTVNKPKTDFFVLSLQR